MIDGGMPVYATLKDMFLETVSRRGDAVALRYKKNAVWHTISYGDLLNRVRNVTELLHEIGIGPGQRVAMYLDNCPQWFEIYLGIVCARITATPIDAKLRENELAYILRHSGSRAIFSSAKGYPLLREIEDQLPDLETVIILDTEEGLHAGKEKAQYLGYDIVMTEVAKKSKGKDSWFNQVSPAADDIASIIYTSGTTGRQKGAMLSHGNFSANVSSCLSAIDVFPSDNFLLVLPLHHVFAFTANFLMPIATGSETSLVESLKTVGENTREVSPSILIGVPLLLEKMYARIWKGLRENRKAYLLYRLGIRGPVRRGILRKLGGNLRMIISGGAPCPVEVLHGFASLGIGILEGYGLTETAPVLTINPQEAPRPGTVGKPLPGVEIAIMDKNNEGVGEIAARGANIMRGYLNDPAATREVMNGDWFLTGDLGRLDKDGYLTITGRKKSLIVNREGKNIYPEEVEACLNTSPLILESLALGYTDGSNKGEKVGVIVVPDGDALMEAHSVSETEGRDSEVINRIIRDEVKRISQKLADYKRPRRIRVRMEEFEKTSTQKIKRYLYELAPVEVEQSE